MTDGWFLVSGAQLCPYAQDGAHEWYELTDAGQLDEVAERCSRCSAERRRPKLIRVTCQGAALVAPASLSPLQGELKTLEAKEYAKLRRAIEKRGFSFPLSVWKESGNPKGPPKRAEWLSVGACSARRKPNRGTGSHDRASIFTRSRRS